MSSILFYSLQDTNDIIPDNIVREALKQLVVLHSTQSGTSTQVTPYTTTLAELHLHAAQKCNAILPIVLSIVRRHTQARTSLLFRYDTGLVKDGCSFAALLLANSDLDDNGTNLSLHPSINVEEGLGICAQALDAMRWAYSSNDRAKQTLLSIWEARKTRDRVRTETSHQESTGWAPPPPSSSPWFQSPSPAHIPADQSELPVWDTSSPSYIPSDFIPLDDNDELTQMFSGSWSNYGHGN